MKKTCSRGHIFNKTSGCPICPACEAAKKPKNGFLSVLVSPARRALENAGVITLDHLAKHSESEILSLHGMGPGSIPKLRSALQSAGLSFRK